MPIRVPTTFYVNIHDENVEGSKQRLAQQKIDQPPQYFFSQTLTKTPNTNLDKTLDLAPLGVNGTVKLQIAPLAKN